MQNVAAGFVDICTWNRFIGYNPSLGWGAVRGVAGLRVGAEGVAETTANANIWEIWRI